MFPFWCLARDNRCMKSTRKRISLACLQSLQWDLCPCRQTLDCSHTPVDQPVCMFQLQVKDTFPTSRTPQAKCDSLFFCRVIPAIVFVDCVTPGLVPASPYHSAIRVPASLECASSICRGKVFPLLCLSGSARTVALSWLSNEHFL